MAAFFGHWRIRLLFIATLLLAAALLLSGIAFTRPLTLEKVVPVVEYEHRGKFDYTVTQKSSYTYEDLPIEAVLGASTPASTPTPTPAPPPQTTPKFPIDMVEGLDLTFSYGINAGKPLTRVTENVEVGAVSQKAGAKQEQTILVPLTLESDNFTVTFSLSGADLAAAASTTITANVTTTVEIDGRPLFETFKQSLSIRTNGTVFELDKMLETSQKASSGDLAYEQTGVFDYAVRLKNDSPFGAAVLKPPATVVPVTRAPPPTTPLSRKTITPGDVIYTSLFESADATYSYELLANCTLKDVKEETEVHVALGEPRVWNREFTLVPTTARSGPFTVPFGLDGSDLMLYQDIYKAVQKETGAPASNNVTIVATTHVSAKTEFGPIDETFQQTLSTTLGKNTIEWNEKLQASKAGSIQIKQTVANSLLGMPVNKAKNASVILCAVFIALLAGVIVLGVIFKPSLVSAAEVQAAQVRKKYHELIVDVTELSDAAKDSATQVASIDELAKISDALMKPILHKAGPEGHVYCVIDGQTCYRYVVNR